MTHVTAAIYHEAGCARHLHWLHSLHSLTPTLFVNQARVIHAGTVSDHLARVIDEDSQMVCAILDRGASHRRRRTH